jgi:hypothetical protein
MSSKPDLTRNDYELLSAYIDGMLIEDERANLEKRLKGESALAEELAILRQTVALVKQLPQLKAPRNFTLTPAMVAKRSTLSLVPRPPHEKRHPFILPFPLMRAASAAASLMIIAFGAIVLLSGSGKSGQDSAAIALSVNQAEVSLHSNTVPADAIATRPPSPEMPMAAPPAASVDAAPPPEIIQLETTVVTQPDASPVPELAYDGEQADLAQQDVIEAEEALPELDNMENDQGMGGGGYDDAPDSVYDAAAPMAPAAESPPGSMEEQSTGIGDDGDSSAMRTTGEAAPDSETIPTPLSQEPQQDEVKTAPSPTTTAIEVASVAEGSEVDRNTASDNTPAEFARNGESSPSSKVETTDNDTLLGVVLILTGSILFMLIVALPWIQRRRI